MEYNNLERLKKRLRSLGFDSRIDGELATYISYDLPSFNLKYQDQFREHQILYHIEFEKSRHAGTYKIPYYVAFLERQVPLLHGFVNDVNTDALEFRLLSFDWQGYTGQKEQLKLLESCRNELTMLSQTQQGQKIAQLLIARYWPMNMAVAERNENVGFDEFTNCYSLKKKILASDNITATEAYQLLKKEMDELTDMKRIPGYAVTMEMAMAKTDVVVMGRSRGTYSNLAEAYAYLENIDYRLFDKSFVISNKLPCYITKLNLIDTLDKGIVASKIIEMGTDPENQKKQIAISYDINEQKFSREDFIRAVNLNVNNSMKTQSLEELHQFLSYFKPSLPRSQLKKIPNIKSKPGRRPGSL